MAFGARATARSRGLVLNIRQRPSYTAGPDLHELRLTDEAHDFVRGRELPPLSECAPGHGVSALAGQLTVTIDPLIAFNATLPVQPSAQAGRFGRGHLGRHPAGPAPRLLILLIRVVIGPVGPIGLDGAASPPVTLLAPASLIGPVLPAGPCSVPVAEWRLDSRSGSRQPLPWRAFPRAADSIAGWVARQAAQQSCDVVVLGARMPQELAVGLGVQLGQRPASWPWRMYPAIYDQGQLVIPDLQLGAEAVPPQRTR